VHPPTPVGIIVARSDSSRLPGKAMAEVAGRPLIGYVIERAKRATGLEGLVLATTGREIDDVLAAYADSLGIGVFRGDTDDVAGRLLDCAREAGATHLARINGDSPWLDPVLLDDAVREAAGDADLVSTIPGRTFPYGVSAEIASVAAMERAYALMSWRDREHVTLYLYEHPDAFRIRAMTSPSSDLARARMVVDTADDLRIFEQVVRELGDTVLTAGYPEVASRYMELGHLR